MNIEMVGGYVLSDSGGNACRGEWHQFLAAHGSASRAATRVGAEYHAGQPRRNGDSHVGYGSNDAGTNTEEHAAPYVDGDTDHADVRGRARRDGVQAGHGHRHEHASADQDSATGTRAMWHAESERHAAAGVSERRG
jgi:hypothetical protein